MQKQSIAFVGQTRKTITQKKLKKVKKQSIALVGQTTKAILVKDSVNRKEKFRTFALRFSILRLFCAVCFCP